MVRMLAIWKLSVVAVYELRHRGTFLQALPRAGETGTLNSKLRGETLRGRVVGKTGTLRDVTALSGFILSEASQPVYSYSFICNDVSDHGKSWQTIESILSMIISSLKR